MSLSSGPGVDAKGQPVIDPSDNVLLWVAAAIQRQDDLRTAEATRQRELAQLRADYGEKLRNAESARIDAIRRVDVEASRRSAADAAKVAQTLADQVATTAETMRTQVAATAQTAAIAQEAALAPIKVAVEDLLRSQYQAQGGKATTTEERGDRRGGWMVAVAVAGVVIAFTTMLVSMAAILVVILLAR